jgi:hypothetical protein
VPESGTRLLSGKAPEVVGKFGDFVKTSRKELSAEDGLSTKKPRTSKKSEAGDAFSDLP